MKISVLQTFSFGFWSCLPLPTIQYHHCIKSKTQYGNSDLNMLNSLKAQIMCPCCFHISPLSLVAQKCRLLVVFSYDHKFLVNKSTGEARQIDLFEEVTKSQASGWVEAEDYKMPPVPMHFYRLVTLDSFFGHCCFLIIFRSVCLQLIGFSEWELLDKYM